MDSSDDELFTATPSYNKSIINTSLNLATKQTNDVVQEPVKEKNFDKCCIKDISIPITHLLNKKKKKITTNRHLAKNKRRRLKWKFGSYKRKTSTKKLSTQQVQVAKEKSSTEDIIPQDAEDVQNGRENAEDFTLLTYETQNKEKDLCVDKTQTCARILSYDVHKKRNTSSSGNIADVVVCYGISSSSSEQNSISNNEQIYTSMLTLSSSSLSSSSLSSSSLSSSSYSNISEQNSLEETDKKKIDKIYASMLTLPENRKRAMQALLHERLRRMSKKLAMQGEPSEWKSKRKRSSSTSFKELNPRKKLQRMLLDESSDDEISLQSKQEMIRNDDQNQFHLSERMDEEEPRSNIPINHEICVTLTKLEQMDDMDVLKWRANKIKNALEIIESQSVKEQHLDKQVKRRKNKNISANECTLSQTQDIHEDLLQLSVAPSTRANKHCPARLNSLDMTNLRKKYKLFKKPRVLIIKLDSLVSPPENGKYSAIEIDCLTKKYIDYVISSTYSKPRELLLYGRLRRKSITDVNTHMENDKRRYNLSGGETMDKSFEQSDIVESSKKDDQVMKSSSNKNTSVISNQSQNKSLSPKTKSKNNNLSQKTLLEIWKGAFCPQKSVKKSQNAHAEQVVSAQSTPAGAVSTLQNSSKKWASTECKSPVSSSLTATSTASTKDNTSVKSPSKHASPKKQESAQSTKRDETSQLECFSNTNSSNIETVKETKDDFLKSQNSTNSTRSPRKKVVKNDIIESSNMELSKKSSKSPKHKNRKFRCFTCNILFDQYQLLMEHRPCPMLDNALNRKKFTKMLNKKIDKIGQDKNSKPSTSQHNSSINKESESCNNTDKENSSSSLSSGSELQSKRLSTPQTNTTLITNLNSDLNLRITRSKTEHTEMKEGSNVNNDKGKQCKVCSRFFNSHLQLFEHMFKHPNRTIKNVYKSSIFSCQKTDKNKNGVSNTLTDEATSTEETRINVQEKGLIENTNESNTDQSLAALQVSQRKEAAKKTDKTSNSSQAEIEQNLQEDNSIPIVNDNRIIIQCTKQYVQKPISSCLCHKLELIENNYTVQIEIVLLCDFCKIVFRRNDCFRIHSRTHRNNENIKWIKRQKNKSTLLLCVACQKVLASIPDLQIHLDMHAKLTHRNLELTFLCNICKIIFHTQGPLFNTHFINHVKNPSFLASRVTFSPNNYAGVELFETLHENGEKHMEVYIKIADYKCQDCCALFASEESLQSHKAILCQKETSVAVNNNNTGTSDSTNACSASKKTERKILLLCGFCNESFYKRADFEMHSLRHKVKRDPRSHYTCVAVTAITQLFICKVCMTMWKSYEGFTEHWQTHNRLQEDYICSICQNHYDTLDLCQEHILTHKNITKHSPISCKVIYRDLDFEANLQQTAINDDLSCASSSLLDGKKSSDTNIADNLTQGKPSRISVKQNLLVEDEQSTREEILKDLLPGRSPKKSQTIGNDVNFQQKSLEQVPSTDVAKSKQTAENGNNKKSKNSNNNSQNSDDLEEEKMIIVVSESEDNLMPNENRKAGSKKTANASPTKRKAQKDSSVTFDPTRIASDEEGQCLSDASAQTSINADKTSESNAELNLMASTSNAAVSLTKEREANANDSEDNEIIVEQVVNLPAMTQQADSACKNVADDGPTSSSAQSTKIKVKDISLPQNAMSSVPKSFLRVKSLAELTDDSSRNFLCHICGLLFDNSLALIKHKTEHVHIRAEMQGVNQAHSSKNIQMSPNKPEFNPSMYRTQIQNPVPHSMTGNALPSGNVLSSGNASVSNNASASNTVSLSNFVLYNMPPSDNVNPSGSVNPSVRVNPYGSVNPSVRVNPSGNVNPSGSVNPSVRVNPSSSVNPIDNASLNRMINLRNFQPHQVVGIKPLHKVPYTITQVVNKVVKPNEAPQYSYSTTGLTKVLGLNNSIVTPQQKPIYHQNLPAQIPHLITTMVQPAHQNIGTVAVRPFIQTIQASRPPPPYPQQQQQQKQQQEQRTTTGSDVRNYSALSKDGVPYQLTSNSTVPTNMTNLNNIFNPMIQVSKNPNRFICLLCPFECTSKQDCATHQHLSKHETRTNYNSALNASRT